LNRKERELHEKQVAINSLKEELKYKEELLRQQQQYLGRQNNTVKTPHSPHSKEILLKENINMNNGADTNPSEEIQ
jgi:hypothetical protein